MWGTFMVTLSCGPEILDLRHQGNVREREWWHLSLIFISHVERFYLMPWPKSSPTAEYSALSQLAAPIHTVLASAHIPR